MKKDNINVIVWDIAGPPEVRSIPNTLEAMQEIVGGWIQVVTVGNSYILVCNEEGRMMNLPPNPYLPSYVGPVFLCRSEGEEFTGVDEDDIEKYVRRPRP